MTTLTVYDKDGNKLKLTFTNEAQKQSWLKANGHNYSIKKS